MELRDYQKRTIAETFKAIRENPGKNPCIVLPTGAGKSVVLAKFCERIIQSKPHLRILMLTHVKELIEQNAQKMKAVWPGAPLGIYSAGLGRKQLGFEITFAGIQSIWNKSLQLGHVDVVFVDECHLIPAGENGRYRSFLGDLGRTNPKLCVIGLTATPWRLGHGLITEGDAAIFDYLVEPTSIMELVEAGCLAPLRSKHTDLQQLDLCKDVGISKGDYKEDELQAALNKSDVNASLVDEIIRRAGDTYKHWLIFCTGVDHARAVADALKERDIPTAVVHGKMSPLERADTLTRYKAGEYKAITNVNVLTTGFDFPDIDLLAFGRPTKSPTLYMQMAGRGSRLKSHTDHCLVLDFGGLVATHGPITDVQPPKKKGKKEKGETPVKTCPKCDELVAVGAKFCPSCLFEFPVAEKEKPKLHNDDIMGAGAVVKVVDWTWQMHLSGQSGKETLRANYELEEPLGSNRFVSEYFALWHGGQPEVWARERFERVARKSGFKVSYDKPLTEIANAAAMGHCYAPATIKVKPDGRFFKVSNHKWAPQPITETDDLLF